MTVSDSLLQKSEIISFALRELYSSRGFSPYRMSKFEEYDLYAQNKDFLVSDNVITFTDTGGKLMALKPDVTLSIIKNSRDLPNETRKVYYNENVYRVSKGTGSFREIMQMGVEYFGSVAEDEVFETLSLAADSLSLISPCSVLCVSCLDVILGIARMMTPPPDSGELFRAVGEKNLREIDRLCPDGEGALLLKRLLGLCGPVADVLPGLEALLDGREGWAEFRRILKRLAAAEHACPVLVDFSVTGDVNYYNGIVFKGFIRNIPNAVLSGGQYDKLMKKLQRRSSAVGFAVYTDELERIDQAESAGDDGFINVALPKGRLGEKVYDLFSRAGFECPSILEPGRKLVFENAEKGVRYFWVKPSDVAIYVERGAADIGVAGKDILAEYAPDVYELLDLKAGRCTVAVAAPAGYSDDNSKTLRVATKFSSIATSFYRTRGRDIDIIHLNGSIELAPVLGLSDVIVDIVETGSTLRENNLAVIETVMPVSARLISNKASSRFKSAGIEKIVSGLSSLVEG